MLHPYHRAQGRRKVGPYEVHLAAGRGGIRAEPILFNAIRLAFGNNAGGVPCVELFCPWP